MIIGPEERAKIAELLALAAANIHDPERIIAATADPAGEAAHRDMMAMHSIDLPIGYVVTYSLERQPPGLCHHISVSIDRPNQKPSLDAVGMILEAFGMEPIMNSARFWLEEIPPAFRVVNIVQIVK